MYYSKRDRQLDASKLVLSKEDVIDFSYKFFKSPVEHDLTGIEFKVNKDIMEFAYKLAVWKEPEVIDKPDYPDRSVEDRIFHLFIGNVTECAAYLYLKNLGLCVKYYDIERENNKYYRELDYDLKLYRGDIAMTMSIKSIPTIYDNIMRRFDSRHMCIKGSPHSADHFYTQFLVFKDNYCEKFNEQDYANLKNNIENGTLNIRFVLIGGIVNYMYLTYEQLRNNYENNDRSIVFTEEFDSPAYMTSLKGSMGLY